MSVCDLESHSLGLSSSVVTYYSVRLGTSDFSELQFSLLENGAKSASC